MSTEQRNRQTVRKEEGKDQNDHRELEQLVESAHQPIDITRTHEQNHRGPDLVPVQALG